MLKAHVTANLTPVVLVFLKRDTTPFERLTQAARAWRELASLPKRLLLGSTLSGDSSAALEAMTAAALAGSAAMPSMKSKPVQPPQLTEIELVGARVRVDTARLMAVDRGNHLARWLTALPPNVLNCRSYRRAVQQLAQQQRWACKFFDEATLRRAGAGAFLAVTRANAHRDAGIVRLRYRAGRRASKKVTLVGKGICFDTGGINLKPHKSMYHMHEDMQGSAVALGTLLALTQLRAPFDIDCWLALTENEIGAQAYRPQEVVTAANGTTIQVVHSDAEGRMALADTLALAAREQPDLILDFATLTGACVTALTERYSGVFTNRSEWHDKLLRAGVNSGERVWPFPMDADFDADLESPLADLLQCTPDSKGDHILAARFLQHFVPESIPWVHVDLSASNRSGGLAHIPTAVTGFGVRFATELLLEQGVLEKDKKKK